MEFIKKFLRDENGVTAVEYGLIAGLMSVLVIAGVTAGGLSLQTIFNNISAHLATGALNSTP